MYGFTSPPSFSESTTSPQCSFSGLEPGVTYGIQVVAQNGLAPSSPVVAFVTVPTPPVTTHPVKKYPRTIRCVKRRSVKHDRGTNPLRSRSVKFKNPLRSAKSATTRVAVLSSAMVLAAGSLILSVPSGATGVSGATLVASGFVGPTAIATDSAGNVYVADQNAGNCVLALDVTAKKCSPDPTMSRVYQIAPGGAQSLYFDAMTQVGFTDRYSITAIAVSPLDGTLAVGPYYGYMYTYATNGTLTYISDNFNDNRGATYDASGNLFFNNDVSCDQCGLDSIAAPLAGGTGASLVHATTVDGNGNSYHFRDVAIDAQHNYFVTDMIDHSVYELSAANPAGAPTLVSSNFTSPQGIAIDASGNLYVADYGRGIIYQITPAGVQSVYSSAFAQPYSLAMGPAGLYVLDLATNSVYLVNGAPSAVTNLQPTRTSTSITVSWTPSAGATSYTCTLMTGFNAPTTFKVYSTSPQCTFNGLDPSTSYGVQVIANGGSAGSSPVISFANVPAAPTTTTTTVHHPAAQKHTITCVKGTVVKHVRAINPRCPAGYKKR